MGKKSGPGKEAEERARLSTESETSEPTSQVVLMYTGPVADPDPGSHAFLTPGSGMGKKSGPGSVIRIWDEQPQNNIFFPRA
jgi:hypothetical protein